MTLLSDVLAYDLDGLSKLVMQPLEDLIASLDILKDKGILKIIDDKITLTKNGTTLQQKLFDIARKHEITMLSHLTKEQSRVLKDGLKKITSMK